jgi:hypothetical protein
LFDFAGDTESGFARRHFVNIKNKTFISDFMQNGNLIGTVIENNDKGIK